MGRRGAAMAARVMSDGSATRRRRARHRHVLPIDRGRSAGSLCRAV